MTIPDYIRMGAAGIGAVIGFLIGEVDGLLYTLLALMVIDYITGVVLAAVKHELNSQIGFKGIAKKVFILLLVIVANLLDKNVLGGSGAARTMVVFFYLANEGLSVLENAGNLGVPYPAGLKKILAQLKDKNDGEGDDNV